ncbi:ATP-binding protein [Rubrivirga litoralis]|uniref:histidine kinase n=1 Tax=Rubrivirga litoralis TaxID=3075598 RepID=A0ABU3BPF4_9BACT|nr:ATP-binding protein [Rubrivirga sp. F394]MDT0631171.1 ATP-binding protein [Rubrivirga sp. F394]
MSLHPAPAFLEDRRLRALLATGLLDTPPEDRFDRLTRLVCRVVGVPIALVSLVDDERQVFKSQQGLSDPWTAGTPLSHSLCQRVARTGRLYQLDDARAGETCDHPAVTEIGVGAYLGVPIRDPDGYALGSLCAIDRDPRAWTADDRATLRDLADIVESEVALTLALDGRTESEARYRGVVESVRDVVVQADAEGRWSFLNPAWETVTGHAVAESLGRPCLDVIHPDDHAEVARNFRSLLSGAVPYVRHECRLLRAGGGVRHVEVHVQLLRSEGGAVRGAAGTITDVTDSIRFEAERVARERTEEMLRIKEAFLGNMSHELRTPLTGILGFAEVLAEEVGTEQREAVDIIVRSAQRLQGTLNSVLDLAQLEGGSFTFEAAPVDLRGEAAEVARLLAPVAEQRGVALDVVGPPVRALADSAALHRVLNNLVGNALKFTDEGGVVVEVGVDDGRAWLRVEDSGIGIDPAFAPRLFDEFAQASTGYTRTHEGNGLGLAITKRLVDLMGGTISVESEPGVGSAFTVRLPAAPVPAWVVGGVGGPSSS